MAGHAQGYKGSCFCGEVEFTLSGEPADDTLARIAAVLKSVV